MIRAVLCERCGTRLERAGQGHTCRPPVAPAGLPLGWQVSTWIVVGLAALLMAGTVLSALVRLRPTGDDPALPLNGFLAELAVGGAWLVLAAGLLAATLVWSRGTRRLADRFSDTSGWYVSVGSVLRLYALLLVLGVGVACLGAGRAGTIVLVGAAVQLLVIAFLAVAVVAGWSRIRRLELDSYTQTYYGATTYRPPSTPSVAPAAPAVAVTLADDPRPDPAAPPIVEQSRGLDPHRAPLTGRATDADWNPYEWDPEVRDEIERRRRDG